MSNYQEFINLVKKGRDLSEVVDAIVSETTMSSAIASTPMPMGPIRPELMTEPPALVKKNRRRKRRRK